jgi:hypothetical protein
MLCAPGRVDSEEICMRKLVVAVLTVGVAVAGFAKDKKKTRLPDPVLNATTVTVAIDPQAGESLTGDQRQARLAVEHALEKWGRFRIVMYPTEVNVPDLIIEIRKGGGAVKQTIHGGPLDRRGSTIDSTNTGLSVGIETGRPNGMPASRPQTQTEVSSPDDIFSVYMTVGSWGGKVLAWRYSGKNALDAPAVRAVEEFKKTIAESEELKKQQKP